jgi:malyl-CoA/(S)-citramalyl-CoA lyase
MVPKVEGAWDIHYVDRLLAQLEAGRAHEADPGARHPRDRAGVANVEEICQRQPAHAGPVARARPTSPPRAA